jgi:hypothetical protein
LLLYRRAVRFILGHRDGRLVRAATWSLATAVLLFLVGFFAYLLTRSLTDGGIQQAYYASFFTAICLMAIFQPERINRSLASTGSGQLIAFMLIWLLVPLVIYLGTRNFSVHGMYIPAIAFSAVLSILLLESSQVVLRGIRKYCSEHLSSPPAPVPSLAAGVVMLIVAAGLAVCLVTYSPLVEAYQEWESSGLVASMFLVRLSEIVPELPDDVIISVWDFQELSNIFWKNLSRKALLISVNIA